MSTYGKRPPCTGIPDSPTFWAEKLPVKTSSEFTPAEGYVDAEDVPVRAMRPPQSMSQPTTGKEQRTCNGTRSKAHRNDIEPTSKTQSTGSETDTSSIRLQLAALTQAVDNRKRELLEVIEGLRVTACPWYSRALADREHGGPDEAASSWLGREPGLVCSRRGMLQSQRAGRLGKNAPGPPTRSTDLRMLSVTEAQAVILEAARPLPGEMVQLAPAALGLVLAEDVASDLDSPPHDKALMDGYAVRSADLPEGRGELEVIEEVTAGVTPRRTVGAEQATRIMTGAPLPDGSDAVVAVERTRLK